MMSPEHTPLLLCGTVNYLSVAEQHQKATAVGEGHSRGGVATCCWERHTGTIKVAPRTIRKGAFDCWYTALTFRRQPSILLFTVAFFLFHIILLDGLVPSFSLTASSFAGEDILFVVANNGTASHCHCSFLLNLSSLLDFVACTSKLRTTNGTVTMSDEI